MDKGKAKIKLERDIRQGDTISPNLFIVVLENIFLMNWENEEIRKNGNYFSHLQFVADILIFSNCPKNLKNMLKDLAETGLTII